MADQQITIASPTLSAGQGFRVEYRVLGTTPWTLFNIVTTNTFLVTGLTTNTTYQFRFTFLKSLSPLVECDSVIDQVFIAEPDPCLDFDVTLEQDGTHYTLVITASGFPTPYVPACGGYKIVYTGPTSGTVNVANFQTQNPVVIPVTGFGVYSVVIQAMNCAGTPTDCYNEDIPIPSPLPTCTPGTLANPVVLNGQLNNPNSYSITIEFNQSLPYQNPITISYSQQNAVNTGVPDPGGTITVTGQNTTTQIITFSVQPNLNVVGNGNGQLIVRYAGSISDGCGGSISWKAESTFVG